MVELAIAEKKTQIQSWSSFMTGKKESITAAELFLYIVLYSETIPNAPKSTFLYLLYVQAVLAHFI